MKSSINWIKKHRYGILITFWIMSLIGALGTKNYDGALLMLIIILDQCLISMDTLKIKQQEEEIDYWQNLTEMYIRENQRINDVIKKAVEEEA